MTTVSFRQLLAVALFAGLISGLILTAVQQFQVVPTILEAETYENTALTESSAAVVKPDSHSHGHEGETGAWSPKDGLERTLFTTVSNVAIGLGFALIMGALISLRGASLSLGKGLLWGVAGYLVFFVSPAIGLHPEIPGTEAATLFDRQVWWIATVASTAVGMALIVFSQNVFAKVVGVILLVVPHAVGAPVPEVHASLAPEALARQFVSATAIANAAFWLALGAATGVLYQRIVKQ